MADAEDRLITAAEMDDMTPNERAAAVSEGIVANWDDLPQAFRQEIIATGKELAEQRAARRVS